MNASGRPAAGPVRAPLIAAFALVAACSGAESAQPPSSPTPARTNQCADAPTWRFERIELPPEFAPTLPEGVEHLYFAPGMFEPGAPDYWSYVFSIRLTEPLAAGADSIESLLELYYRGLIAAVAASKQLAVPDPVATVSVAAKPGGFVAEIETVDAFTGGQPIALTLEIELGADRRCLELAASAAAPGSPVWNTLAEARRCVACADTLVR